MSQTPTYRLKLILAGASSVGKSSLLCRYVDDAFSPNISSTVGVDFKSKTVKVERRGRGAKKRETETVKLTIWDTAGQERFRTLSAAFWRNTQGAILVYDITSRKSFEDIQMWLEELHRHSSYPNIVKILVGNKADLESDRQVERADGEQFAREHGMMFIEASALTSEGVEQAFEEVVYKILETDDLAQTGLAIKTGVTEKLLQQDKDGDEDNNEEGGCCW